MTKPTIRDTIADHVDKPVRIICNGKWGELMATLRVVEELGILVDEIVQDEPEQLSRVFLGWPSIQKIELVPVPAKP